MNIQIPYARALKVIKETIYKTVNNELLETKFTMLKDFDKISTMTETNCILQIDISKAYDKPDRETLIALLTHKHLK